MIKPFAEYLKSPLENLFLFSKGRVALYALLKALDIGENDDVLMSGYTCVMVPSAVKYLGARCRYVDINPSTFNLDPGKLDSLLTPRTKALIVQHTYGIAQNMGPVLDWACRHNLPIIEDSCHAFGSRWNGKLCGTFGVGAFFSGQWNKPFSTGLGGILLVNDANLLPEVERLYQTAILPSMAAELRLWLQIKAYNTLVRPQTNALMTCLYRLMSRLGLAAGSSAKEEFEGEMPQHYFQRMAKVQMKEGERNYNNIERLIEHRKAIAAIYSRDLPGLGFRTLKADPECDNVILRYPIRVANKSELLKKAAFKGFELGSWFEIPLHPAGIDMARFGYTKGKCPESEKACQEVVNLPMHGKVTLQITERTLEFLKRYGNSV
ncbi:MAG: DegT/DnrJ/EryC1/StrS family aminotransferase [Fibrobacterota bacterium]